MDTIAKPQLQWVVGPENPLQRVVGETPKQARVAEKKASRLVGENNNLPEYAEVDKTGVVKASEVRRQEIEDLRAQREGERANVDLWRQEVDAFFHKDLLDLVNPVQINAGRFDALEAKRIQLGIELSEIKTVFDKRKTVEEWDNAAPPEMGEDQANELERTRIAQEKLKQNENLQRENLGIALLNNRVVLEAGTGHEWPEKVKVLQGLQSGYDTVNVLTEQGIRLNAQRATLWGEVDGDADGWKVKAENDAQELAGKRVKHPIDMKGVEALQKIENLTDVEVTWRSGKVVKRYSELVNELNGLRQAEGKSNLNDIELTQLRREWGITTSEDATGSTVYNYEPESVMESLLVAEAMNQATTTALKENLDAVTKGDLDCVEMAFEVANLKVQSETMEVVAHNMILGKMNQQEAQAAIKMAQELGLVDEVGRLQKFMDGYKELDKKMTGLCQKWAKGVIDFVKDPESWKKIGKGLLIGIGIALLLAILAAVGMAGMLGGALGGGGR